MVQRRDGVDGTLIGVEDLWTEALPVSSVVVEPGDGEGNAQTVVDPADLLADGLEVAHDLVAGGGADALGDEQANQTGQLVADQQLGETLQVGRQLAEGDIAGQPVATGSVGEQC